MSFLIKSTCRGDVRKPMALSAKRLAAMAAASLLLASCAAEQSGIGSSAFKAPIAAAGTRPGASQVASAPSTHMPVQGGGGAALPLMIVGAATVYILVKGTEVAVDAFDGPDVFLLLNDEDQKLAAQAFLKAYVSDSGATFAWHNPSDGAKGYVTATGPRYAVEESYCRRFRHIFWTGQYGSMTEGKACLDDESGWTLTAEAN